VTRRATVLVAVAVALLGVALGVGVALVDDGGTAATGPAPEGGVIPDPPCTVAVTVLDFETSPGGGVYFVATVTGGEAPRRVSGADVAYDPAISPDGSRIAYVRAIGDYESAGPEATEIWTMGIDGADPRPVATDALRHGHPAWSPDGRRLAFVRTVAEGPGTRTEELVTTDADGGDLRVVAQVEGVGRTQLGAVDWSPDGARLVHLAHRTAFDNGPLPTEVRVVPAAGGPVEVLAEVPAGLSVDWSPDGAALAVTSVVRPGPRLTVLDAATGVARDEVDGVVHARWSGSGDRVLGLRGDDLVALDLPSGEPQVIAALGPVAGDVALGPGC
jgi:Tol biopolymer transport system component